MPFRKPQSRPVAIAAAAATQMPRPVLFIMSPATMPESAVMAPTEKSISPAVMQKVRPKPRMAMTAT